MRKSEKLSDAIGEINDDIIEEAYTYKPKHDMHQRKASFNQLFLHFFHNLSFVLFLSEKSTNSAHAFLHLV